MRKFYQMKLFQHNGQTLRDSVAKDQNYKDELVILDQKARSHCCGNIMKDIKVCMKCRVQDHILKTLHACFSLKIQRLLTGIRI